MPCSVIDIVTNSEIVIDVRCDDKQTKGVDNPAFHCTQGLPEIQLRRRSSLIANGKLPTSSSLEEYTTEYKFRNDYLRLKEKKTLRESLSEQCTKCWTCSSEKCKKTLDKILPCFKIVRKYKLKDDLPNDIVCGLTVGIMQIPQGMAFAMLAYLPPVVGLYMGFFPVLIYFLLGTSRHIAMGTAAAVSLVVGTVIAKFEDLENSNSVVGSNSTNSSVVGVAAVKLPDSTKIGIIISLALLVGFIQIAMGLFRLGFITTYISDPLVGGFTTGIGLLICTSQVKHILGVTIPKTDGLFQLIRTWIAIIEVIPKTNIATIIISIICMILLYIVKEHINQRFKHKLKVPFPIEIVVVILGTAASYIWNFEERFHVKIVGDIPTGLPTPRIPKIERVDLYIVELFIIAIIGFAQSVSLAALMAKKHCYSLDSNQELIAYGVGNVFGSFFSCYPYSASVAGSFVQESSGGKTQVASLFSASLIVVVIVWIGYLFESLPNCVLSSIIIIALKNLILQFGDLPKIWRTSRFDFFIWVVTCACTALLSVDYGLLIGVVFSFFSVVIRTQRAVVSPLGKINDRNLYRDSRKYVTREQNEGITIVNFNSALYFANADLFVTKLHRITGVKPEKISKQLRRMIIKDVLKREDTLPAENNKEDINAETSLNTPSYTVMNGHVEKHAPTRVDICPVHHIILDFSAVAFIDSVGVKILKQEFEEYSKIDIKVFLACVSDDVWAVLETTEFLKKYSENIFLTVDIAVTTAQQEEDNVNVPNNVITHL